MSIFIQRDTSPAYNITFRTVSPIIFIILISSIYYYFKLDFLVKNIFIITPIYFFYRISYNVLLNKWQLINKKREILISLISSIASYVIYIKFIIFKTNLLPDPANLTGELWIIIILYLYSTFNSIDIGTAGSEKRREKYYRKYYNRFKFKYGDKIALTKPSPILESLIYTIMIYENFNRPPFFRFLERMIFPYFSKTLGIMQVETKEKISDEQSVDIAIERISNKYNTSLNIVKTQTDNSSHYVSQAGETLNATGGVIREVLKDYNKDEEYIDGVNEMHSIVISEFYPNIELYT